MLRACLLNHNGSFKFPNIFITAYLTGSKGDPIKNSAPSDSMSQRQADEGDVITKSLRVPLILGMNHI